MQTLHPGFPERVLMQVSEQEVGHFTETAKEDQVAGNCFRRIGSALRPQCCPALPGRGQTHVLAYLESLTEQPGAGCPGRASFEMFTFLVTSH